MSRNPDHKKEVLVQGRKKAHRSDSERQINLVLSGPVATVLKNGDILEITLIPLGGG